MTVRLTMDKRIRMHALQGRSKYIIREIGSLIGLLVSSFPAVMCEPLHYRQLKQEKSNAIKDNNTDYEALMSLSTDAKTKLQW